MTEIEKARELFVSCRLKEAKPLLEELAGAGDSDALYMLAMMTYDGISLSSFWQRALRKEMRAPS